MIASALGACGRRWYRYTLCALVILGSSVAVAQQQSEFDKMLEGKPFDADKLLRELPDDPAPPGFNSPSRVSPDDPLLVGGKPTISLVLPLDAPGLIGEAAAAFLEGFASAAENDGVYLSLDTYRTDGQAGSGLEAYRQAVTNGADVVVGPLVRSSVEQVARLPLESTVTTLLLQLPERGTHAGQIGAPPLFAFPLGGEAEIIQFSRLTSKAEFTSVHVVLENSQLGEKLGRVFDFHRPRLRNLIPQTHRIINAESWNQLHVQLRKLVSKSAQGVAVFAAGGGEFASQARANIPGAIPIYALAATQESLNSGSRNLLNLDGLRFFEMPYLLQLRDGQSTVVAKEYAVGLSYFLQRYVAAGMDGYQLASAAAVWSKQDKWSINGATGRVFRNGSSFDREGVLVELREGQLVEVTTSADKNAVQY